MDLSNPKHNLLINQQELNNNQQGICNSTFEDDDLKNKTIYVDNISINQNKINNNLTNKDEFVYNLLNKKDQIKNGQLKRNKYLILFLKNLYLRKSKKYVTILEIVLPVFVFCYAIFYYGKLETNQNPNKSSIQNILNHTIINSTINIDQLNIDQLNIDQLNIDQLNIDQLNIDNLNVASQFRYPIIYYDFNSTNVNEKDLTNIFNKISLHDDVKFKRLPKDLNKIKEIDYMIVKFNFINRKLVDYEMKIVDDPRYYMDWFEAEKLFGVKLPKIYFKYRLDADKFHELFLKTHLIQFNSKVDDYHFKLDFIDEKDITEENIKLKYKPDILNKFSNLFFYAFFLNSFNILTNICDEKKKRLFDLLKLMGATENQILSGHFLNHFSIWLFPFTICIVYFVGYYVKNVPINLIILFILFGLIFLIYFLVFLMLLSSPFTKAIFPNLLLGFSIILEGSSFTQTESDFSFLSFLKLSHPVTMLKKFSFIGTTMCVDFDFKENFFKIITYSTKNEISFLSLFFIAIFFIIIEYLITLYILQVNPFQLGYAKPLNFFLKREYWKPSARPISVHDLPKQNDFEEIPASKQPVILLKDVSKSYKSLLGKKYQVLKNFNFAIYENQITILLGHNGAGKSTTISCMTGLCGFDQGTITVCNKMVGTCSNDYKQHIGYCSQENIFYEDLTVLQNLKLAAILKGVSFSSVNEKILNLTKKFDLQEKLNSAAKTLSGGMKRRLCLAIAIIGYNDVLVIDEPTSGLDPENRRKVWEILLELRKYKTILLTTHFMEEADVLGDQIAIMHGCRVKACGSTMYLKKLYHVGYLLRLELTKELDNELFGLIKQFIPDVVCENQQNNEYFLRLLSNETDKNLNLLIADLFDRFENSEIKERYGIKAYGLTNTSLEDVFIKIGTLDQKQDEEKIQITNLKENHPLNNLTRVYGIKLYLLQFYAIIRKKFILTCKNLPLFASSLYLLVLPVCIVVFVFPILINYSLNEVDQSINSFELFGQNKEFILVKNNDENDDQINIFKKQNKWINSKLGLKITLSESNSIKETIKEFTKSKVNEFKNNVLFLTERIDENTYHFYNQPFTTPFGIIGSIDVFYKTILKEIDSNLDLDIKLKFKLEEHDKKDGISSQIMKILKYFVFQIQLNMLTVLIMGMVFSYPFVSFVQHLNDEMNSGSLDMQIIAGLSKSMYWIGNFLFDYIFLFIIVLISCYIIQLFDTKLLIYGPYFGLILLMFSLTSLNCLLATYFIINLNFRKEITSMIIQYSFSLAGTVIGLYDVVYNSFVKLFLKLVISNEIKPSSIPMAFFYKILSPIYNVIDCLAKLNDMFAYKLCMKKKQLDYCKILNVRDFNLHNNLLAYLISISIFIILIILVNYFNQFFKRAVEKLSFKFFEKKKDKIKEQEENVANREIADALGEIVDENVGKEIEIAKTLINSNNPNHNNILIVHDLLKQFGSFKAVDHLSFTVKKQECFGLLGINGAGKTTTFKMIGGDHVQTGGKILLDNYSFETNSYEYYRRLAYCPQENTHTNKISVLENLRFFARINGIPNRLIERTVKTLIEECDLQEHQFKFAEKLSGGNRRKLATAISLIGRKDLILLDEFTTGVDPVARRHLWKTIDFYKKQMKTSFILTSHSMDEVEQLCNRISIMASGRFKTIGTFSYLREKYSQGFTITIKVKDNLNNAEYIEHLKDKINNEFKGNARLKEFYNSTMIYIILSKAYNWSDMFRKMEQIKENFNLQDFLISDTNLEQIFLSFADKPEID